MLVVIRTRHLGHSDKLPLARLPLLLGAAVMPLRMLHLLHVLLHTTTRCPCQAAWLGCRSLQRCVGCCPEQVIILRKDVDYTLHGMSDADEMDLE